ncbi:MAG: Phosphoglycerate kinase, partial [Streblomastix strix]
KAKVKFALDCKKADDDVKALGVHEVLLLENLRFYPDEERNAPEFAAKLASYGTYYINDAFGTAHRAHASTEGITKFFPGKSACGDLMGLEVQYLDGACTNPKRPFVGILGGAKLSDKLNVVTNLVKNVDKLIIGGGMSYTFLWSKGIGVGEAMVQVNQQKFCDAVLKEFGDKIVLPIDFFAVEKLDQKAQTSSQPQIFDLSRIPDNFEPCVMGPKTRELFAGIIKSAKTVVWNGQMGAFEIENLQGGTFAIAAAVAEATKLGAITVVGGGDSASAVEKSGVTVSHVSTGGGASLEYLEGKLLHGLEALTDTNIKQITSKQKHFNV